MRGIACLCKYRIIFVSLFTTCWDKWKMRLWGVEYGKKCKFNGSTLFAKRRGSRIIIGNNCEFNSSSYYNFRGINHRCILQTGKPEAIIKIGNGCGFSGCSIVSNISVIIGNNVLCGANVIIGDRDDHEDKYPSNPRPILIGDNVWLGMNVVVMKGVTIGENTIIGANSIVTRDIPANCVAVGNPCRKIKDR